MTNNLSKEEEILIGNSDIFYKDIVLFLIRNSKKSDDRRFAKKTNLVFFIIVQSFTIFIVINLVFLSLDVNKSSMDVLDDIANKQKANANVDYYNAFNLDGKPVTVSSDKVKPFLGLPAFDEAIDQARSLNIKILSEEDWKKILNN